MMANFASVSIGMVILGILSACATTEYAIQKPSGVNDNKRVRVIVERSAWSQGGGLDFYILDGGGVLSPPKGVAKNYLYCQYLRARDDHPVFKGSPNATTEITLEYTHPAQRVASQKGDAVGEILWIEALAYSHEAQKSRYSTRLPAGSLFAGRSTRLEGRELPFELATEMKNQMRPTIELTLGNLSRCVHGVEIGKLGPGSQLEWEREAGPLTVWMHITGGFIMGESDTFLSPTIQTENGMTYSFQAYNGQLKFLGSK